MEIRNIKLLSSDPVFRDGVYGVFVGYIENDNHLQDIPHYLIINMEHKVVEGSRTVLFEARGECSYLNFQAEKQNELIADGESLFDEEPLKAAKDRQWN